MIQKIKSRRVELPPIFLVENEEDFKSLPKGLPYIMGKQSELNFITVFLEFQILYKSCMKTNLPVKWLDCLHRLGYNNLKTYTLSSGGEYSSSSTGDREISIDEFVEEQYFVNFDRLAELKILPKWLDDIKSSIEVNIVDEVVFDPTAFNKQLGMNIGYGSVSHKMKNLLILDVSSSIPTAIVKSITILAKLMSKKFFADVMITSGQTVIIDYNDVPDSDIVEIARKSGGGNEGNMYKELIKEPKEYNTVICFGDNDSPQGCVGDIICNFKVETLYSLHTEGASSSNLAGYCRAFKPKTTHKVTDWVNSINK